MKLVILSDRIPPENAGGAERVAWLLARGLHEAGHEVHVIAAYQPESGMVAGAEIRREVREGIPTYHLPTIIPERFRAWRSVYNPQTIPPLIALLHEIRPDVINAHNVHGALSWSALDVGNELGIPVVFTAHDLMSVAYGKVTHFIDPAQTDLPARVNYRLPRFHNLRQMHFRFNPLRTPQIRDMVRHAAARVAVSEAQRQALADNGMAGFEVVPNGIDPAEFEVSPADIAAYRATLGNRPTILFAGRISREKGAYLLLDALERVIQTVPDAQLLMLGTPELAAPILKDRPALSPHIHFGGWLNGRALSTAFCAADVIAAPSIFLESLGMVALEGMAARKPLVVSCFGGLPETVEEGVNGFIVNPFDTGALADRLSRLLGDPALRERMGAAGYARIGERFTLARQMAAMTAIFERVRRSG